MRMDTALAPLFSYPIEDILAVLPEEADPAWDASKMRQRRYAVHQTTRSITFRWLEKLAPSGPQPVLTASNSPTPLIAAVTACAEAIEQHFQGSVVRLLLVELAAGGTIPPHCDAGELLSSTHRCHLPLTTNPSVRFMIGAEFFHLDAGIVYEMDNMRRHGVENAGGTRRVHLVCNVLPA